MKVKFNLPNEPIQKSDSIEQIKPDDEAVRMMEITPTSEKEESSQLQREIDLYLTLPKPSERSKVNISTLTFSFVLNDLNFFQSLRFMF